jgi:16S rRNA A1518/A1519 N6-dimethyltransferase RsmA/KsgA/DIM1 with predicted DNA glycosylase/AP lyase activity
MYVEDTHLHFVGNLPFNISAELTTLLLAMIANKTKPFHHRPISLTFMYQLELARASPVSPSYFLSTF